MKKLFFLLSFLFITSFVVNAQETIKEPEVDITQAERIIDKYSAKVTTAVTNIVTELEKPAKEVFETVVKLQIAKGVFYLLIACFGLFSLVLNIINFSKWIDESEGISIIFLIISAIAFGLPLYWGLLYTFAPKWFAILQLIEVVN